MSQERKSPTSAEHREGCNRARQTLFLGLSDGARIDAFRRANKDLNHEQIWQTHELADDRVDELLEKLSSHMIDINAVGHDKPKFRSIVLLDDFSASGTSYYMPKDGKSAGGKIAKFLRALKEEGSAPFRLCDPGGVEIVILIYLATEQAISHLRNALKDPIPGVKSIRVETIQALPSNIKVARGDSSNAFTSLIDKYYDDTTHDVVFDVHMQKGNTPDARYGYADCGLPVILHHNSPNNSLAILWFYENCHDRGLFPRIQRHREMT